MKPRTEVCRRHVSRRPLSRPAPPSRRGRQLRLPYALCSRSLFETAKPSKMRDFSRIPHSYLRRSWGITLMREMRDVLATKNYISATDNLAFVAGKATVMRGFLALFLAALDPKLRPLGPRFGPPPPLELSCLTPPSRSGMLPHMCCPQRDLP